MPFSSEVPLTTSGLESILDRDLDRVSVEFQTRWANAGASFERPIIFHGIGPLGRVALDLFRKATGGDPVAFTDNNPQNRGTTIDGVSVVDPASAIDKWGVTGVFVATLYNPAAVIAQLRRMGAQVVVPWHWMFAADEEHFLPYWGFDTPERVFAQPDRVLAGAEVWADDTSRQIYFDQVRWLMTLDSDGLMPSRSIRDAYFDHEIVQLSDHETFVDCGAFDGDSFMAFREQTAGAFESAYLIEPDPDNCRHLTQWLATLSPDEQSRVTIRNCALGREDGTARFAALGDVDSSLDARGTVEVTIRPLDELVPASKASFVKVDVEGAEIELIEGASSILGEARSTWTVMTYHRPEHLWEIPLAIAAHGGRNLHLRRYAEDCWERCVYAVPMP